MAETGFGSRTDQTLSRPPPSADLDAHPIVSTVATGETYPFGNGCKTYKSGQKLHKYFGSLRVRGTSLLTRLYIDELRNGQKFECENEPFIVLILIL